MSAAERHGATMLAVLYGMAVLTLAAPSLAQPAPAPTAAPASAPPVEPSKRLTEKEVDALLGPIALYPDVLLAQMLPASAYPYDIVRAHRWIEGNKAAIEKKDFADADRQDWDVSVKSLVRFPDVIAKMNADLDWTEQLGHLFVDQPKDVSASIQRLRKLALQSGALKSTEQQTVVAGSAAISVQPAKPDTIYVPQYEASAVYAKPADSSSSGAGAAVVGFTVGVVLGIAIADNNCWDWGRGYVYPPIWVPGHNPPGYRPGVNPPGHNPPGYGPPGGPWRPDPVRYRPAPTPYAAGPRPPAPVPAAAPAAPPAAKPVTQPPRPPAAKPAAPPANADRTVPRAVPTRTTFDHAGDTGRTRAHSQRGSASRGAPGPRG